MPIRLHMESIFIPPSLRDNAEGELKQNRNIGLHVGGLEMCVMIIVRKERGIIDTQALRGGRGGSGVKISCCFQRA